MKTMAIFVKESGTSQANRVKIKTFPNGNGSNYGYSFSTEVGKLSSARAAYTNLQL
jgi:hypothetical protein